MIKKAALALMLGASSLLAIDSVSGLAVSAPHNSGTVTNDNTVTFTWSPPSGVSKYYYSLDTNSSGNIYASGRNYTTITSSSATTVTATASASGNYYFHIAAVDTNGTAGAVETLQVNSEIDIDAGSVNYSVNAGAITTDSNDITLTGTETGKLFFTMDGTDVNTSDETNSSSTKYVQNTTSNPSVTVTLAVGATINAKLTDQAGNTQSSASSATYTITNNPSVVKANETNTSIDGQTINTGDTGTNALKVTGTELTRYMYRKSTDSSWTTVSDINTTITIDTLSSGTYTYYVRGGDAYNFQSDSAKTSVTFTVDNTAPSSLAISTVSKGTADEDNTSSVTFADNFQFTLSSDDSNATLYYTTDGSTPTTSSSVYSSAVTTTQTVSAGSTGTVTIKMLAVDSAGNQATVKSVTFTIDKQQPTLSMPTAQEISSGATLDVSIGSDDSNATIYYLVSDSNTTTISALQNSGSTGSTATIGQNPSNSQQSDQYKYLHAIAVDLVGNGDEDTSDIQTVSYTFSASAVTLSLSGVTAGATVATKNDYNATSLVSSITVGISGQSGTTYYYKYKFNDSNISGETARTTSSTTISLATLADGNNTLYIGVDSNDSGDFNLTEQNLSFIVDNTPPSTVSQSDVNYTTSTYDVTLSMPSGASTMKYTVNGGTEQSTSSSSATITLTQDENASSTIVVYAEDSVGNESNRTSAVYTRNAAKTRVLSASALAFGSKNNLTKTTGNITVTNTGNSQTTIQSTTLSTSSDFAISSNSCVSQVIAAGGTCVVAVDFNTSSSGDKNATLQIQYNGTSDTELNVSISGTGVNNIPTTTYTDDINISEDTNGSVTLTATDIEGSNLSFYIDTNTTNGTVTLETNGSLTYVPSANYNGTDWFVYYVNDGESNSTDRNITINIAAVNDLPLIEINGSTESSISVTADGNFTISYETNDTKDNEDVNVSATIDSSLGSVDVNQSAKTITFTAGGITRGTSNYFIVTFSDNSGTDVNRTVNISYSNNKPVPTVASNVSNINISEDGNSANNLILLSDQDDDNITVSVSTAPSNGSVTLSDYNITGSENNTTFTYTPSTNYNGTDTFTLKFDDGFGGITYQSISVNISSVNDAPTFDQNISDIAVNEDASNITIDLNASDVEGSTLTYSISSSDTSKVSISTQSAANGVYSLSFAPNQYGNVTISYAVSDGSLSTQNTFDINISSVNDAPTVSNLSEISLVENFGTRDVNLTFSDVDSSTIATTALDVNSSNTAIVTVSDDNNRTITLTSVSNADGNATITISVTLDDQNGATPTYVKTFNVIVRNSRVDTANAPTGTNTVYNGDGTSETSYTDSNTSVAIKITQDPSTQKDNFEVVKGDVKRYITSDVTGTDTTLDGNGTVKTTKAGSDYNTSISVLTSGVSTATVEKSGFKFELNTEFSGEANTTISSTGGIETKLTASSSNEVTVSIDTNGTATNTISVGSKTSKVTVDTLDTNTTLDTSGNISTKITLSDNREIQIDVSATDGKITPNKPTGVSSVPSELPAGTTTTVTSTGISYSSILDSNNTTISFK